MPSLKELSGRYPLWLCDIWGVVHDGERPFHATIGGLQRHRANGGAVVLVTNSPRTAQGVERQLAEIGVAADCCDAIATSGDVTRELIVSAGGGRLFHLGPARDLSILDGLDVARVPLDAAHAILCTGLFEELTETPGDYAGLLAEAKSRGLAMICANPDRVVKKGDRLLPCAGALADAYGALGGEVLMAGKPFAPIYDLAMAKAAQAGGRAFRRNEALAIGDGPDTDILGAARYGVDALLVADGVTDAGGSLEATARRVKVRVPTARIVATVRDLSWDEEG